MIEQDRAGGYPVRHRARSPPPAGSLTPASRSTG